MLTICSIYLIVVALLGCLFLLGCVCGLFKFSSVSFKLSKIFVWVVHMSSYYPFIIQDLEWYLSFLIFLVCFFSQCFVLLMSLIISSSTLLIVKEPTFVSLTFTTVFLFPIIDFWSLSFLPSCFGLFHSFVLVYF